MIEPYAASRGRGLFGTAIRLTHSAVATHCGVARANGTDVVTVPCSEGVWCFFLFAVYHSASQRATSGVFMSLFYENGEYLDVRSCGWERAVGQLLKPVWGELSLRAFSSEPRWPYLFHVRDRLLLQSFMSSPPFQTEDSKNYQFKLFSSC